MNKEFVDYKTALELKELGYDEPCFAYYNYNGTHFFNYKPKTDDKNLTKAPLYQQAFRWFREKHELGHMINGIGYEAFCMGVGGVSAYFSPFKFKTYEEAEQACLDKLIEIIKKQNDGKY